MVHRSERQFRQRGPAASWKSQGGKPARLSAEQQGDPQLEHRDWGESGWEEGRPDHADLAAVTGAQDLHKTGVRRHGRV